MNVSIVTIARSRLHLHLSDPPADDPIEMKGSPMGREANKKAGRTPDIGTDAAQTEEGKREQGKKP